MAAAWQPSSTASGSVRPNFAVGTRDRSQSESLNKHRHVQTAEAPAPTGASPRAPSRPLILGTRSVYGPPGPQVAPGPVIGPECPMLPSTPRE